MRKITMDILNGEVTTFSGNLYDKQKLANDLCEGLKYVYTFHKDWDEWLIAKTRFERFITNNFSAELIALSIRTVINVYQLPINIKYINQLV